MTPPRTSRVLRALPPRPRPSTARAPIVAAVRTLVGLALALLAAPAAAQGGLGMQGFGYPTGQLSTRVLATGGGLAEFDALTPLNPATAGGIGRVVLGVQHDPEWRRTTVEGASYRGTVSRFPLIGVGIPVRQRYGLALSASTYLDRSFTTERETSSLIGEERVTTRERIESRGAIADLRVAFGAVATRWLRVGVAGHALTGENRLVSGRSFGDTTRFGSVSDSSTLDYSGLAVSAGVEVTPLRGLSIAGSARRGGTLRTLRADTTLTRGDAPDRYGLGLRVDRVTGATFAAGWSRTTWTNMRTLADPRPGRAAFDVRDADELMAGIEAVGPRIGESVILLRLGGRQRDLPFGVRGAAIQERAYSGGLGVPFVGGRALADLAVQHATRTTDGAAGVSAAVRDARERAWTLSVGFTVRP